MPHGRQTGRGTCMIGDAVDEHRPMPISTNHRSSRSDREDMVVGIDDGNGRDVVTDMNSRLNVDGTAHHARSGTVTRHVEVLHWAVAIVRDGGLEIEALGGRRRARGGKVGDAHVGGGRQLLLLDLNRLAVDV